MPSKMCLVSGATQMCRSVPEPLTLTLSLRNLDGDDGDDDDDDGDDDAEVAPLSINGKFSALLVSLCCVAVPGSLK